MPPSILLGVLLLLAISGYFFGRAGAVGAAGGERLAVLHSTPAYHGLYIALWCAIPALIVALLWIALEGRIVQAIVLGGIGPDTLTTWARTAIAEPGASAAVDALSRGGVDALDPSQRELLWLQLRFIADGQTRFVPEAVVSVLAAEADRLAMLESLSNWALFVIGLVLAIGALVLTRRQISRDFRARNSVERIIGVFLIACSVLAVLTTAGIVLSLLFESLRFFAQVSPFDFLFGLRWSPQTALRADQVGSSGSFGAVPLFTGTLLISVIAMLVAVPVGLMSAIYLADYAPRTVRMIIKPVLEVLAGIPTVVYGFFAILTIAPVIRDAGAWLDAVVFGPAFGFQLGVSSNSALAAGVVMGVMIIPYVSSLSDDVINAVPQSLRDGSSGLGATRSETIRQVILPAALPGIVGAVLLAVSRAIGETMIVVMAAGLAANLTANPFAAVTTVTVQIATLLVGDQEFDSPKTLSVFALGLVLFLVTLSLNIFALGIVRKYREKYD